MVDAALQPTAARWIERHGSHLAVLRYDDVRALPDRPAAVLDFYECAYQAGARRAGWDIAHWACPGGVTDMTIARSDAHRTS